MTKTKASKSPSPEFRYLEDMGRHMREDLLQDPFAYRPLQPLSTDGPLLKRLPGRLGVLLSWAPHAIVAFATLILFAMGHVTGNTGGSENAMRAIIGLVSAAPALLTLIRPIGAWWALAGAVPLAGLLDSFSGYGGYFPWTPATAGTALVVMTVVTFRTRPRVGVWMWLGVAGGSLFFSTILGSDMFLSGVILFIGAIVLLVTSLWHVRRDAQHVVTVERSATAAERSRRTLLEERTTIARELHDVVAHHMSVVAIQAEAAPYRVENPPPELEQAFVAIRENAVAALTELRRVLGVVRAEDYEAPDAPQPVLADLGVLLGHVRDAGLSVDDVVTGAVRDLPQGVELSAYRIVQEALSNALRHAPGASARVELAYVLGGLGLRIVNTAPSGEAPPSPGAGHGITGMRERVAMLNGEMTAGPTADGGYEVAAFLPVSSEPEPVRQPQDSEPQGSEGQGSEPGRGDPGQGGADTATSPGNAPTVRMDKPSPWGSS